MITKQYDNEKVDLHIYLLFSDQVEFNSFPALQSFVHKENFTKRDAINVVYGNEEEGDSIVVGLGPASELTEERLRAIAGEVGRRINNEQWNSAAIHFDVLVQRLTERALRYVTAWLEGYALGTYRFDKYQKSSKTNSLNKMYLQGAQSLPLNELIAKAESRGRGVAFSRDLANEPPNKLRPAQIIQQAIRRFEGTGVDCKFYAGEELEKLEMNGLIAVGKGSVYPPAIGVFTYCTDESLPLVALVGKGMTFDTGGISLKSGRDLSDMRMDMAGAAAVLGALDVIVQQQAKANVVVIVPTAENTPSGHAMIPGELIEYRNGLTVQVGNTDAEGRLILADALLLAEELGAKQVIDIATLTGACMNALGPRYAGIWGDEQMVASLRELGEQNGDRVWPLPLDEEYMSSLKSDYADLNNISSESTGGAISAALFLKQFIDENLRWVHIDMAGTMDVKKTTGYHIAGARGYGARLLADYVLSQ